MLTVNCIFRGAARFCYAVLLSMGPKKSHGTNAVAKSSREIQNRRGAARGRGRRSRARASPGPVDLRRASLVGQKIPRHRRRRQELARDTESAGPRSRPPIADQGREIQTGGWRCRAELRGAGVVVVVCCCMQKSSAPFFFSFRRFLFCTQAEVRYLAKRGCHHDLRRRCSTAPSGRPRRRDRRCRRSLGIRRWPVRLRRPSRWPKAARLRQEPVA